MPIEFQLLGHAPGKWRPENCLGRMAGLVMVWAEGRYFPLAFSRRKVEEMTQHRLVLRPTER